MLLEKTDRFWKAGLIEILKAPWMPESAPATARVYGNNEEKGYNLPIDVRQRAEAEEDCKKMMGLYGSYIKMQIKAVRPMLSLQMKS